MRVLYTAATEPLQRQIYAEVPAIWPERMEVPFVRDDLGHDKSSAIKCAWVLCQYVSVVYILAPC